MTKQPWEEADITINGEPLTIGQAMTIRVALEVFATDISEGLGDDEHGKRMTQAYKESIIGIRKHLYNKK